MLLDALFAAALLGQGALAWALGRAARLLPDPPQDAPQKGPPVRVVIAVDERTRDLGGCLDALLVETEYQPLEIVVVRSPGAQDAAFAATDRAGAEPRLRVVDGPAVNPAWPGRAGALAQGAAGAQAEWLLFLDPDTRVAPDAIGRAVAAATAAQADLWSALPASDLRTLGELVTLPVFLQASLAALQPDRVADPARGAATAAATGAFLLARTRAYTEVGGHHALLGAQSDDVGLARIFKREGKRIALGRGAELASIRKYHGLGALWRGFRDRTVASMASAAVGPPTALAILLVLGAPIGSLLVLAAAVWLGYAPRVAGPLFWMGIGHAALGYWIRGILVRRFGVSPWPLLLQPAGALIAASIVLDASARVAALGPSRALEN